MKTSSNKSVKVNLEKLPHAELETMFNPRQVRLAKGGGGLVRWAGSAEVWLAGQYFSW